MIELKPCPFCGSDELDIWQNDAGNYFVVCIGCGANGRDERKEEKAVEVWNRRTFTCPVCGVRVSDEPSREL